MFKIFTPARTLKIFSPLLFSATIACGGDTGTDPEVVDDGDDIQTVIDEPLVNAPVIAVAACGDMPMTDGVPGLSADMPTDIDVGNIVRNEVIEMPHHYRVMLPRGTYHFVADGEAIIRLEADDETVVSERDNLVFSSGIRSSRFLEVEADVLVHVTVVTGSYAMGFFDNGSAIPSPRFTSCPEMKVLDMETPNSHQSVVGPRTTSERWFSVDLEEGPYVLEVRTEASLTDIDVFLVDGFGDRQDFLFVDHETEELPIRFDVENPGTKWVLVSMTNSTYDETKDYRVEMTLMRP